MNKTLELLKLFEKFGVKPGKIIGTGDRKVVPIKKPILSKPLNRDYLLEDVEGGKLGINTVKNEIEDIAPLFFQKQLNDVEINNIVNNLNYLDKLLNPTNVLDITTKAPVKGLESLKPTSIAGGLEKAGKQLEEVGKKLEETKPEININDLIKDFAQGQRAMQDEYKRGLTRATARSILYKDIEAGKIKGMTFEQLGNAKDPIDDFRKIYGENALEQLDSLTDDFSQMRSAEEAATFAKTKFKFEPRASDLPETTTIEEAKKAEEEFGINKPAKVKDFKEEVTKRTSIDDLIDEYNANQDRLRLSDEEGGTAISYDEFRKLQERNKQIADALENKGISSKIEEEVKPEGIVIPFRKKITEPEEFADGGIIRTKFAAGGKGKKVLDIIKKTNKELKGKKSMETVNPKTGEVTVADEFVTTAETPPKAGQGRFTKQHVLERIIQSTIDENPTDEYVQTTFPNFLKELRANPELVKNENVWKNITQGIPENKRIVVYGDDTVDIFSQGENLPEGMRQTQELANTYGISMEEATRIKQMEPTDQVMEIKKLEVLKSRNQNADGGLNYLMGF